MGGDQFIHDAVLNSGGAGLLLGPSESLGAKAESTRDEDGAEEDEAEEAGRIDDRDPGT